MNRLSPWVPTFTMMLVSFISYVDRNTLALLAPTILAETKMTGEQYGWVISAFSILYMIGNPVWGRLLDRFGVRSGMIAAVSFWTLASISHAFASGFGGFAAARAMLGFGEGATFPGGLRTVMQTLTPDRRSRGIAIAYSGGSLGAIVTPLIITPIAIWGGWRAAFLFTGVIGLAWILLWLVVSRRPEVRRYKQIEQAAGAASAAKPRWSDARLWSFMATYALGALPVGFVIYSSALYLSRVLGKSQEEIGAVLWIPPLGWEIGYFFWGFTADALFRSGREPISIYRRLMGAGVVLGLPLAVVPWISSFPAVLSLMFLGMFVAAGFIIIPIAYGTYIYSANHSGLIAGLGAGAWSAVMALAMPVFGRLFDLERYDLAFGAAVTAPFLGYAFWLLANRKPAMVG